MPINLWGASPLYENESLKECSLPAVTPIDQVLDEGNRGRVTGRGKAARECAVKPTSFLRRRPHSRQSCEATNRNLIQGRYAQVSEPTLSETVSFGRIGKSRACAAKVNRLIQGGLQPKSGSRPCAESRRQVVQATRRLQQAAEIIVLTRHTPLSTGRTEL